MPTRKRAAASNGREKLPDSRQFKPKRRGNPNPHPPPVEYQFKPGQSGNPGGKHKLLSSAYKDWLKTVNPNDPQGRTNAEIVAASQGIQAMKGDTRAAREIRQATEGDIIRFDRMTDDELLEFIQGRIASGGDSDGAGTDAPAGAV